MSRPLFGIGDRVCDLDGDRVGIVLSVGPVDECAGRRYHVAEVPDVSPPKWRNESNLKRAPRISDLGSPLDDWS